MSTSSTPLKLKYAPLGRDDTFALRVECGEDPTVGEVLGKIGPRLKIPSGLEFWLVCDNTGLDWTND